MSRLYIPKFNVRTGLYTAGNEFFILGNVDDDYIGFYHQISKNEFATGAEPTRQSIPLIKLPITINSESNRGYYKLTGIGTNRYTDPVYSIPNITNEIRYRGIISRFICQQINDHTNIIEIDRTQYDNANYDNSIGLDRNRYMIYELSWTISGPRDDVQKANIRALATAELIVPGIRMYLSDPLEFYQ